LARKLKNYHASRLALQDAPCKCSCDDRANFDA
jgi:hypothetical protein